MLKCIVKTRSFNYFWQAVLTHQVPCCCEAGHVHWMSWHSLVTCISSDFRDLVDSLHTETTRLTVTIKYSKLRIVRSGARCIPRLVRSRPVVSAASVIGWETRPLLILATGHGFATRPRLEEVNGFASTKSRTCLRTGKICWRDKQNQRNITWIVGPYKIKVNKFQLPQYQSERLWKWASCTPM